MSVVCGAIKNGEVAIACDTQTSYGSIVATSDYQKNSTKIFAVNRSVIGLVGWSAVNQIVEHLITNESKIFKLNNRMEIFSTLLALHEKMKTDYFLETATTDDDQPVESNQLDALVINEHGLFEVGDYREVNEYSKFWAIGSGRRFALGAMHAVYESVSQVKEVVEAGVKAGAEFSDDCSLPVICKVMTLAKSA